MFLKTTNRLQKIAEQLIEENRECVQFELSGKDSKLYSRLSEVCEEKKMNTDVMLADIYRKGVIPYLTYVNNKRNLSELLIEEAPEVLIDNLCEDKKWVSFMLYGEDAKNHKKLLKSCNEQEVDISTLLRRIYRIGVAYYEQRALNGISVLKRKPWMLLNSPN